MSIYVKVTKNGNEMGVLKIEELSDVVMIFDKMYDRGFIVEKITEEQYNSTEYGDELSSEDIRKGNYKIG